MSAHIYTAGFKERRFRIIAQAVGSSRLFIAVEDLIEVLAAAMPELGRVGWARFVRKRLSCTDPLARQRAFIGGRIMPTVSAELVIRLCHNAGRLAKKNPRLRPAMGRYQELRKFIYRHLGAVRCLLALSAQEDRRSTS
jgi:hypothetical protein